MAALDRMAAVARGASRNLYRPAGQTGNVPGYAPPMPQAAPDNPFSGLGGTGDGGGTAPEGPQIITTPDGQQWYVWPDGSHSLVPQQKPDYQIPTGGGAFGAPGPGGDQSFNITSPYDVAGSGGQPLPYTPEMVGATTPQGLGLINNAETGLLLGSSQNPAADFQTLVSSGRYTPAQALALIKAMNASQGDNGSGVGYAQLAQRQQEFEYQKEQDALNRAYTEKQDTLTNLLNELSAIRQQQVLATTARDNARTALISAAPNLNDGRQYFGGYEPGGPAQALADFSGYTFNPQPLRTVPIGFDPNPAAADPQAMAVLNRLMGGQ